MKYRASQQAKILGIFLIVGFFCSSLMIFRVQSAQQDADIISSAGTISDEVPYSYLIFQNATATYMVNGVTDTIDFSSTNASAVIDNVDGNLTGNDEVYMKAGTYQIANVTLNQAAHWVGEDGCVWNLTAKPCLTVNAATVFENINFSTTVDGYGLVVITNGDQTFQKCTFNLNADTTDISYAVFEDEATTPNNIIFEDTTLSGGRTGAGCFMFWQFTTNFTSLTSQNLHITNVIVGGATQDNRTYIFDTSGTTCGGTVSFSDTTWDAVTCSCASIFHAWDYISSIAVDGLTINGPGTWIPGTNGAASNGYFNPFGISYVGSMTIINVTIKDRCHITLTGNQISINNWVQSKLSNASDHFLGGIDLPRSSSYSVYPMQVSINNLQMTCGCVECDGIQKLTLTNSYFRNGDLYLADEDASHEPLYVEVNNIQWTYYDSWGHGYDGVVIAYDQGLNLAQLSMYNIQYNGTLLNPWGSSAFPSQITLSQITSMRTSSADKLVDGDPRSDNNAFLWLSDSSICTSSAPFGSWSILPNDRLSNDTFIKASDNTITYSEYASSRTNDTDTTFTFTDTLVANPVFVSCSFNVTGYTGYSWTRSGNVITVTVKVAPAVSAFTCYIYAKVTL